MNKEGSKRINQRVRKIIGLVISLTILVILYTKVDIVALKEVFRKFSYFYFLVILLTFVVIYFLSAWRWKIMARPYCRLSFLESIKLIASSSSLNIMLPSKIGAFAKAYFMSTNGHTEIKPAISMVIYEKFSDLASMSFIFILASILNYKFNSLIIVTSIVAIFFLFCFVSLHIINIFDNKFVRYFRKKKIIDKFVEFAEIIYIFNNNPDIRKTNLIKINSITFILFMVHITQMVLFFYLVDLHVPVLTISSYMLCATFVGLLPISIAGLGTRDFAIVYLFKGILTYNEAISIGILSVLRYIIPTLIGLPFFIHLMFSKEDRAISKRQCFGRF